MTDIFITAFGTSLTAVLQILLIALAAGLLRRKNVLTSQHVDSLAAMMVRVLLPCLIFSSIINNFYPAKLKIWPLIPLAAVIMCGFGLAVGAIFLGRNLKDKKYLLAAASLQNAGYLILPIGRVLYPGQFNEFALYCFLFIMGISPIIWSLGKYLVSSESRDSKWYGQFLSPPFVTSLLAIFIVLAHLRGFIPEIAVNSITFLGSATVPMAIFILGAILAGVSLNFRGCLFDAVRVIVVKLILTPIFTIIILYLLNINQNYPLLARLLVLQSAAAPATALIIQVRHYRGPEKELGSVVLLCYLSCIVTIPLWIAVWECIVSLSN